MSTPELSAAQLARTLRALADRVDSGADVFEVSMETERVGHATKTTIVLWGLEKGQRHSVSQTTPAVPAVQWCTRLIASWSGPDRLCNTMLRADGTCPRHDAPREAASR